jgi:hypothetical protein
MLKINLNIFLLCVAGLLLQSCVEDDLESTENDPLMINLYCPPAYASESQKDIKTGLAWTFSFLGAELPLGSLNENMEWVDERTIKVNLGGLGFSNEAQSVLQDLIRKLKDSEEYRRHHSMDIGRFVTLTLNSSNHYYAITRAKPTFTEYLSGKTLNEKNAAVLTSAIANGHRLIQVSDHRRPDQLAFIAQEGTGSIEQNTFIAQEFETLDLMPNGQLRFALYDVSGNLKTSASPELTRAGKPAKCLWCHETSLQAPFVDDHQLDGFYSTQELKELIMSSMQIIAMSREELVSEIDFQAQADHTKAELLYLSFMEPSASRISMEWRLPLDQTLEILRGLPTHSHNEFSFFAENLYYRADVDRLAPFESIRPPDNAREAGGYEPDLIGIF